ncbi:SPOR domain-containing protein [Chelativorans xinjiangense]|uniref:SPOR domain-containing protein n=1 Tax=Chelativorans xinjiangense TaxID=2681485 RepID=UPI001359D1D0|nr:SPOR domain-containing protein [Chelativorans xinjiangense]
MADSNYSNATGPRDLAQDDPFSELTRIMGHDTRPIPKSEPEQEEPADNLTLELENELLGDLADETDQAYAADTALDEEEASFRQYAQAPEPDLMAEETSEPDPTLDDTFGSAFDDVFAAGEPAAIEDSEAADDVDAEPAGFAEEGGTQEGAGDDPFMIREEDLAALDSDFAMYDQEAEAAAADGDEPPPSEEAEYGASFGNDEPLYGHEPDAAAAIGDEPQAPEEAEYGASFGNDEPLYGHEPDAAAAIGDEPQAPEEAAEYGAPFGNGEPLYDHEPDAAAAISDEPQAAEEAEYGAPLGNDQPLYDHEPDAAVAISDEPQAPEEAEYGASFGNEEPLHDHEPDAAAAIGDEPQVPEEAEYGTSFGDDEPASEEPEYFSAADAARATYSQAPEDGWMAASTRAGDDADVPADEPQAGTEGGDVLGEWSPEALFAGLGDQDWHQDGEGDAEPEAPAADPMPPEVDTVEVPEGAVALADNLDVPDVPYQKEEVKAELDEIEEMLAGAFGEGNEAADGLDDAWMETAPRPADAPQEPDDQEIDDYLSAGIGAGVGAGIAAYAAQQPSGDVYGHPASGHDQGIREWSATSDELIPVPGAEPPVADAGRRFGSRAVMAAAIVGGVAILGGVTVFALTFSGGDADEPALVKADDTPVKVRPENPGGTTIPNQDNQVYRRVSGETEEAEPGQTRLVSTTEEPVDLPAAEPQTGDNGAAKLEERLENPVEEATGGNETATLTPRRVRSFVVQPDGTMVPNDVPEPVETADDNADSVANAAAADDAETLAATRTETTDEPSAATQNAQADADGNTVEAAAANAVSVPPSGPIPPARPSNIAPAQQQANAQPPSANANAQAQQQSTPTQVAAAQPQPTQTAAESGWSVQISSQASVEGAQQSYQELAQRHGNLLQGKGVNIVKADIEGKGTYYRVRIPSSSKDEAIRLCEQLKAAGGSCFVSK